MAASSDRNLLFGILALQMDFITREQLVAGMHAWVAEKELPLAEHLARAGALKLANRQLLEPLVEAHIQQHGDDPQQSLEALSSGSGIREQLAGIADAEIQHSLSLVGRNLKDDDPFRTETFAIPNAASQALVGQSTSDGVRFRIVRPHAKGGLGEVFV